MDMSQYLDTFLEEAREHLHKLDQGLLSLEVSPDNKNVLDGIFRSAHTLKGMSATMGYNSVAELTHEMENLLHKLRNGEVHSSIKYTDLLFKCVDSLNTMICDISEGGKGELQVDRLLAELRDSGIDTSLPHIKSSQTENTSSENIYSENVQDQDVHSEDSHTTYASVITVEFNEFEKSLIKEAADQGYQCYHLVVYINPQCVMKSARAFMIFKNVELVGEIVKSIPAVHDIEEERFEDSFELIIISGESPEVIRESLVSLTEVEEPEINCITGIINLLPSDKEINNSPDVFLDINQAADPAEQKEMIPAHAAVANFGQTVRVDKAKLDNLMNLVGELVISKTRLEQINRVHHLPELSETLEQMDRTASDLQDVVMKVRMIPIDNVFSRFPRMVRDLARDTGKEVELLIEGADTELDRTVIDEIGDPLVHLLRNAVDHGIEPPPLRLAAGKNEQGQVILSARHEGNNVVIEVEDDGKGIDPDLLKNKAVEKGLITPEEAAGLDDVSSLRLMLIPGFSTVQTVTDISGRGVGLDAVQNTIEALNGTLQIQSAPGAGTKFRIQLPLTLAIIQALLISIENETYAIPLSFIAETTSVANHEVNRMQDQEYIFVRGDVLPLKRLSEVFQVPDSSIPKEPEINIVVVRKGKKKVGLVVDNLIGQQEIVIKPLGKLFGNIPVIAGGTILGNGQVALIVDVAGLL